MTKDELKNLRNERGKQELKIGDKVSVQYLSGIRLGTICEVKYGGLYDVCYGVDCVGHDIPENLIKRAICPVCGYNVEFPTDEIKVGDRVVAHVGPNMDWYGTVKKIIPDTDRLYGENLLEIRVDGGCLLRHRVSRCTKINPVKVDLDDTYWQHYMAELTKEVAAKVAVSGGFDTAEDEADYVTAYVDRIVDNLKKNSE